jgi:16S rRNA (uracil1498-N3)-methyltransferase
MHISYHPDAKPGLLPLGEEESKHCVRVLRMAEGDPLLVTDGKGFIYQAQIQLAHPKRCIIELQMGEKGYDHWPYWVHIALAPTKQNERMEWFLEKATEVGVDEISLFHSFHSERRKVNTDRWKKIMVSAMKQSMKSRLPKLNEIMPFEQFISQPFDGQKFIAWISENEMEQLVKIYKSGSNCLVLIGPEGDFSQYEVEMALKNEFVPISLGKARLRTETAALVACQTVQLINQKYS